MAAQKATDLRRLLAEVAANGPLLALRSVSLSAPGGISAFIGKERYVQAAW